MNLRKNVHDKGVTHEHHDRIHQIVVWLASTAIDTYKLQITLCGTALALLPISISLFAENSETGKWMLVITALFLVMGAVCGTFALSSVNRQARAEYLQKGHVIGLVKEKTLEISLATLLFAFLHVVGYVFGYCFLAASICYNVL